MLHADKSLTELQPKDNYLVPSSNGDWKDSEGDMGPTHRVSIKIHRFLLKRSYSSI